MSRQQLLQRWSELKHDPLCGWHTKTGCFDEQEDCFECVIIARTRADERSNNFTPDDVSEMVTEMIKAKERAPHDPLCNNYEKTCCPWMGECECQCNCDFIAAVRHDDRKRITKGEILEDYMCPFCVTPWKCNGPHIDEDDLEEFEAYVQDRIKEAFDEVHPTA